MSKRIIVVLAVLVWLVGAGAARGATIALFEWAVNQDGVISDSLVADPLPANWNGAGFDFGTGLGTLTAAITGAGAHNVLLFLDIEIDEIANTFFNEVGGPGATSPGAGQSWEVDEPGYAFGDIYDNFADGTLDNAVGTNLPEDVSVALGWAFVLGAGEMATLTFKVGQARPTGFFLAQYDPDSDVSIYFSSTAEIRPIGVPEPATLLLLGTGLLMLGARVRSRH